MKPWMLCLYGALGAITPDVLILYSKRWTRPDLSFDPKLYVAATFAYMFLAAIVALIYPYGRNRSPWKAFLVGCGLPVILSGVATLKTGNPLSPRGETVPISQGTLTELLSLT